MKVRVHELAKELGYEKSGSFIEKISEIGIKDKKPISGLTDEEVKLIKEKLSNNKSNKKSEGKEIKISEQREHVIKEKLVFNTKNSQMKKPEAKQENIKEMPKSKENENTLTGKEGNPFRVENREKSRDNREERFNKDTRHVNIRENRENKENNVSEKDNSRNGFNRNEKRHHNSYNDRRNDNNSRYNNENRNNESRNRERFDRNSGKNFDRNDNKNYQGRDGRQQYQPKDENKERQGQGDNRFNRNNRDGQGQNNRNFDKSDKGNYQNKGNFQNQSKDNQGNKDNKRFDRDKKDFKRRDGRTSFDNKGKEDFKNDKGFGNKNKKEISKNEASGAASPIAEKPKGNIKGKAKFDKKKYEKEKKQKEEEKKLRELRSDFRKDDKKKKGRKKQEKIMKDEIIRIEGESIGMITIREEIVIKDLAEKLGINVSDIIKKFFMQGKILTANAILSFEEAEEIALDYDVIVEKEEVQEISYGEKYNLEIEDKEQDLITRAPVITIMGHVDHGKTSLLDALRHTNVIEGEAGGITQRIGAYQVNWKGQKITFIDTPGHEAFTEMRARGANITDISILIVAADDGVKPQTVEAISHAKEAGVPIIVAINKIDKPGADPMKVRTELTEYGLMSLDWGGNTEFVEISAKQKINLEELLETILITSELLELKANPKKRAKAVVVESRLDPKMGAVADILIQEGELKIGDIFVAGEAHGRVRSMVDDRGNKIEKAFLSQPVEITGFSDVPNAGDILYGVNNDKQAKKIVEDFVKEKKVNDQNKKKHISLESLSQELEEQQLKELKCIIRADSKGSVEALKESLQKLSNDKVMINIIQASAGAVTEGDVKLAEASNAIIVAFNVRPTTPARNEAEKSGVEIRNYNVIYHVTEEIEKAMTGMLDPEYKEVYFGRIEVKQVFKISNVGNIAGAIVVDGKVSRTSKIRIIRDGIIIFDGELESLKRFKDDAKEVVMGQECGIGIKDFNDIKEGDIIESYILEEITR
ncbi:translation initiation factor IF-2 [Leptotrichia sp. OH3620_COT-345]|uniref:translation initiation factor IF-2 n=1 Tax=Leptotrichia sp. OH3620_COT-345 TaxID=2491048 RepID=UPI000F654374|nr:translation initiation factor IF-2 [Leptotrichia sp. OH3620_COT-345]RRD38993.1 translation initiation factor IF-2 [Leptotrichia sp. OH3620_COT-345]